MGIIGCVRPIIIIRSLIDNVHHVSTLCAVNESESAARIAEGRASEPNFGQFA